MLSLLTAIAVLAQPPKLPEDVLNGAWSAKGGPVFTFFQPGSGQNPPCGCFCYRDRIGVVRGPKLMPDGTMAAAWVVGLPDRLDPGSIGDWYSPWEVKPANSGWTGEWRAEFWALKADGYPGGAKLKMSSKMGDAISGLSLEFICPLSQIDMRGLYKGDKHSVNFTPNADKPNEVRGTLESFGRQYDFTCSLRAGLPNDASIRSPMLTFRLTDHQYGTVVGVGLLIWDPSDTCVEELKSGKGVPTDQVMLIFHAKDSPSAANIVRILKRTT